jgi:hypothetical protein
LITNISLLVTCLESLKSTYQWGLERSKLVLLLEIGHKWLIDHVLSSELAIILLHQQIANAIVLIWVDD